MNKEEYNSNLYYRTLEDVTINKVVAIQYTGNNYLEICKEFSDPSKVKIRESINTNDVAKKDLLIMSFNIPGNFNMGTANSVYINNWVVRDSALTVYVLGDEVFSKRYKKVENTDDIITFNLKIADFFDAFEICNVCGGPINKEEPFHSITIRRMQFIIGGANKYEDSLHIHDKCWKQYKHAIVEKLVSENDVVDLTNIRR